MKKAVLFLLGVAFMAVTACGRTNSNNSLKQETMTAESNAQVVYLTKAEFLEKVYNFEKNPSEWKYEGDKPAIVDFYATWCGPCKMVAPILEELAKEYDGQIVIYKVDTEKESDLASVFGIRSIPSILFIPMEGKPEMAQGAMPKASFKKAIDEFLLKK
ncbi:thioredoxin [Phocaeicola sp.]